MKKLYLRKRLNNYMVSTRAIKFSLNFLFISIKISLGTVKQRRSANEIVCKHWLIGSCFRINCPYLHSYEFDNMPLCPTLRKFGSCNREVCVFSHSLSINSNKSRKECRAYERGFCKYGSYGNTFSITMSYKI